MKIGLLLRKMKIKIKKSTTTTMRIFCVQPINDNDCNINHDSQVIYYIYKTITQKRNIYKHLLLITIFVFDIEKSIK